MSNMVTRRALLRTSALIPVGLFLVDCTAAQQAQFSKVSADIETIAGAITGVLPALAAVKGVSASVMAKIGQAAADLKTLAGAMSGATATAATTTVGTVENVINGVLGAVGGLSLPSGLNSVFSAISALLPAIEQGVGIVTTLMAPAAGGMSANTARSVLKAAAAGH